MSYIPSREITPRHIPTVSDLKVAVYISGLGEVDQSLYKYIITPLSATVFISNGNIDSLSSSSLSSVEAMFKRLYVLSNQYPCEDYDVIIRLRPDMILRDYLPHESLLAATQHKVVMFPKNQLRHSVRKYIHQKNLSYTDTMFLAAPKEMKILCNIWNSVEIKNTDIGENILSKYIHDNNLPTYVVYDYEILLKRHLMTRSNLIVFIISKMKQHYYP